MVDRNNISIVGLVLGIVGKKKNPTGMATAGIVLSIIGLILSTLVIIACIACIGAAGGLAALA